MEPDPRYARRTGGYKSPVLLIKLIRHKMRTKFVPILYLYNC